MGNFQVTTLIILLFTSYLSAKPNYLNPNIYSEEDKILRIEHEIYVLEDTSSKLSFDEVKNSNKFKKSDMNVPNLGVSESTFWTKFRVKNETGVTKLLLQLSYPIMDIADLYYSNDGSIYSVCYAGDILPYKNRIYNNPNFIYDIQIPKNETRTFFLKIKAKEQILLPILVAKSDTLFEYNSKTDLIIGIYIGIILVMFLYNSFILYTTRDIKYLCHIIYIFFIGINQISFLGYLHKRIWLHNSWLSDHGLFIAATVGSSAIAIFMLKFLRMHEFTPKLVYGVYAILLIYSIALFLSLIEIYSLSYKLIDLNGIFITFFSLFVAATIALKGYKPARYFIIGWSVFLIGVLIFELRSFGLFPYNMLTNYTMPFGSAIEVVLLSLALADRINILKKEKEESQAQTLAILKENERIITEQNIYLEQKVNERTLDLKKSNAELSSTLTELKETQSQLVNSEKMASLGQLTAGVAHEINNPINFVVSNVNPLRRDIQDLKELLSKYEKLKIGEPIEIQLAEIQKFKKEIDIDYLNEEIDILLKGITEGANRTAEIVQSLKNFSRVDESDLKKANINDGIKSSLVLLTQQLTNIKTELNFAELPLIECYPGKLNQVFMNILTNAIEAIKSNSKKDGNDFLYVTTYLEGEHVVVKIKDSGIGIPDEVKQKIFDPFFTTKDVGKGTGLGLSITHGIIEKHKGSIKVDSEVGKGTEFTITFPIARPDIA